MGEVTNAIGFPLEFRKAIRMPRSHSSSIKSDDKLIPR